MGCPCAQEQDSHATGNSGKVRELVKTVFQVMKSPGICNFHHFSVNRPGIWFALEMSGPERSVRFKAANK